MTDTKEFFNKMIIEYRPRLFRLEKGILNHDADAEDAVSETVCKAFTHYDSLRNKESFKPWLFKILVNESYTIAKKRKRFLPLQEDIALRSEEDNIIDTYLIWNSIHQLKDEFKAVTILFYYENMTIQEISKVLDIPEGTVNSRLNRARKKLKQILIGGDEVYE